MEIKVVEHDFRPGGKEFISDGVYRQIVKHEKIISSANFKPMTEGVEIQVPFEANGVKTDFTFNVVHQSEEYCRQQEQTGLMNG